jgi:hypothetical protein
MAKEIFCDLKNPIEIENTKKPYLLYDKLNKAMADVISNARQSMRHYAKFKESKEYQYLNKLIDTLIDFKNRLHPYQYQFKGNWIIPKAYMLDAIYQLSKQTGCFFNGLDKQGMNHKIKAINEIYGNNSACESSFLVNYQYKRIANKYEAGVLNLIKEIYRPLLYKTLI